MRDHQVSQLLEYSFNGGNPVQFVINDATRPVAVTTQRVSYKLPAPGARLSSTTLLDRNKKSKPTRSGKPVSVPQQPAKTRAATQQFVKTAALNNDKNGLWEVQIGSYAQQKKAHAQAKVAKKWVSGSVVISEIAVSNRKLYRARLVGLQEEQARAGCQSLSRQGMECLIVRSHG